MHRHGTELSLPPHGRDRRFSDHWHSHSYNDSWRCECGFVLPLELQPVAHGLLEISGPVDDVMLATRSREDMGSWFLRMLEYGGAPNPKRVYGIAREGKGNIVVRWKRISDDQL